jgi:hypothetical protein
MKFSDAELIDQFSASYAPFIQNFKGERDIAKVLDISHLSDDVQALMDETARHPAVYAYWANMRMIAERKFEELSNNFELVKSRYTPAVLQHLKSMGNPKPTLKKIETTFTEMNGKQSWFIKYKEAIAKWEKRKTELVILEKAIMERGAALKSMAYLMSNMMNTGIYVHKRK